MELYHPAKDINGQFILARRLSSYTIDLKKKIFSRWIDEQPHIGDIPANEVPISLVEEHPDVLHAFYHVFLGS